MPKPRPPGVEPRDEKLARLRAIREAKQAETSRVAAERKARNDHLNAEVRRLWLEGGKSGTEIGAILGVTANTVISRANRMGLAFQKPGYVNPGGKRKPTNAGRRQPAPRIVSHRPSPPLPKDEPMTPKARISPVEALPFLAVPFADLGPRQCKWIANDPRDGALCCGQPQATGRPYCAHHAWLSVAPAGTKPAVAQGYPVRRAA